MRTQSLFLLSSGLLFGTTALTGVAYAQKGIALEPKTQWAVSQVGGASENGYCAIARRFEKNVIMTVARNQKNENSIALDFETGSFDEGQNYKVFLDPGAGQQRQFSIRPVSKKAFVFKIGTDYPFLNALKRTGYMRVEIDDEIFNLNLADIDQGQAELENCVRDGNKAANASGVNGALPPIAEGASEANAQLHVRLRNLEAENARLKTQVEQKIAAAPRPSLTVTDQARIDAFKEQVVSLEQENQKLQKLYADATDALNSDKGGAVANLARENMRLQALLDNMQDDDQEAAEMAALNSRLSALEEENLSLSRKLQDAHVNAERLATLEQQLTRVRTENAQLEALASSQNVGRQEQVSESLTALENENAKFSDRIAALRKENADVMAQLGQYESENKALKARLAETASMASKAADSELLAQMREQIRSIEQDNLRELALKESEVVQAKEMLETSQSLMQEKLEQQKAAKAKLEMELQRAHSELDKQRAQFEAKLEQVQNDRHASIEKLESMDAEMASLLSSLDQANQNSARYETQFEKVRADLKELEAAYEIALVDDESMQQKLEMLQSKGVDLEDQLAAMESEKAAVFNSIETAAGEERSEHDEMQTQISALESEKLQLMAQLDRIVQEKRVALEKVQILSNERLDMEERIANLVAGQRGRSEEIAELSRVKEEALASLEIVRREKENLQQEYEALNQKYERLQTENAQQIAALEAEKENMAEEYAALQERMMVQERADNKELQALQARVDTLSTENDALNVAVENARTFNESLQAMNEDAVKRLDSMQEQTMDITARHSSAEDAKLKLAIVQEENEQLRKTLKLQEGQMQALVHAHQMTENSGVIKREKENGAAHDAEIARMETQNKILQEKLAVMQGARADIRQTSMARPAEVTSVSTPERDMELASAEIKEPTRNNQSSQIHREEITKLNDIEPSSGSETQKVSASEMRQNVSLRNEAAHQIKSVSDDEVGAYMAGQFETSAQAQEAAMKRRMQNVRPRGQALDVQKHDKTLDDVVSNIVDDEPRNRRTEKKATNAVPTDGVEKQFVVTGQNPSQVAENKEHAMRHEEPLKKNQTHDELVEILALANISLDKPVQRVENASVHGTDAYQWYGNNVYGSAMQKPMHSAYDFDGFVRTYLEKAQSRCQGDFAVTPSMSTQNGATRIDGYEIACVGNGVDSSASLLFYNTNGMFTALAHEAPVANMGGAMDMRDRVAQTIKKAQI